MGSRDNFLHAMKSMRESSNQPKDKAEGFQNAAATESAAPENTPEPDILPAVQAVEDEYQNQSEPAELYSDYEEPQYSSTSSADTTVISKGTSIVGEIRSTSNVEMTGNLKGNLMTTGDIKLCGKVIGDVKGNNIDLISGEVKGNIIASAALTIDKSSVVVGDTSAANILMDGKQKGNMTVECMADFQANALLMGNVSTARLAISEGAKLQGAIEVRIDTSAQDIFTEEIEVEQPVLEITEE